MVTKRCLTVVVLCVLLSALIMAQDSGQKKAMLKEFTRSAKMDGVIFSFVLLNNKTVDALFAGNGIDAIRARANMATTFFVLGVTDRDITLDPQFVVEQNGKKFTGEAINIKNLQAGAVAKGTRIEGLIQLSEKINVTQPFKIKGVHNSAAAEFTLSREAIKLLEN